MLSESYDGSSDGTRYARPPDVLLSLSSEPA